MEAFDKWIWNDRFWLPQNYTWNDLKSNVGRYGQPGDLIFPIVAGGVIVVAKLITQRFILSKLGEHLGLHGPPTKRLCPIGKTGELNGKLRAKDGGWGLLEHLRLWLTIVVECNRPIKLKKFTESSWGFICHTALWIQGFCALVNTPWFWDFNLFYDGHPNHVISNEVWWYFVTSSGFYWAQLFFQLCDTKRKGFWEMVIHHVATILLISFAYVTQATRGGSVVMFLHDTSDVFLEATKVTLTGIGGTTLRNMFFAIFVISWAITRLWIFPWYIVRRMWTETFFPALYVVATMLTFLFFLHVYWTYFIVKLVRKIFSHEKIEDPRSCSENEDEDVDNKKRKER